MTLFVFVAYGNNQPGSIMDQTLWDGFNWISSNTPEDAKIYFFYGDRYSQSAMFFADKRNSWAVDIRDFIGTMQNVTLRGSYISNSNGGGIFIRKGLFDFEQQPFPSSKKNICDFDYFVFDKVGQYQQLVQYNMIIEDYFLKQNMTIVYRNQLMDIVKNNKVGGECV